MKLRSSPWVTCLDRNAPMASAIRSSARSLHPGLDFCWAQGYPAARRQPDTPRGPELAPGGLTARQSHGDVAHRGIGLGSVPMAFTRLDVRDVTDLDLKSLGFGGDPPAARGDDQNLIAIVNMPACVASLAEVHDAAIEIRRFPRLDDG